MKYTVSHKSLQDYLFGTFRLIELKIFVTMPLCDDVHGEWNSLLTSGRLDVVWLLSLQRRQPALQSNLILLQHVRNDAPAAAAAAVRYIQLWFVLLVISISI